MRGICDMLQHILQHMLQHMLQHTGTHCNTLPYAAFTGIQYICIHTHHIYRHTIYMCTHMCAHSTRTNTHTHTHTHTHAHTNNRWSPWLSICTYIHSCTYTHISHWKNVHTWIKTHIYTHVNNRWWMEFNTPSPTVSTRTYTHIYTHTSTPGNGWNSISPHPRHDSQRSQARKSAHGGPVYLFFFFKLFFFPNFCLEPMCYKCHSLYAHRCDLLPRV